MDPALENTAAQPVEHYFTVDVEEYFHVSAFERYVSRDDWNTLPSRLEPQLDYLLDLLARHSGHGTFFTLGWVADRYPALVRRISDAGHEVASHSYWHRRITTITPADFRDDLKTSKSSLEQATGRRVLGFRAPTFSIVPGREWALEILHEEGFTYDSSLFPVRRRGYGYPDSPLIPHHFGLRRGGSIIEIPMTMARIGRLRIPASGGGWFRQFPYAVTRLAFQQRSEERIPAVFYIHPWEVDPDQPRVNCPPITRLRHYRGIEKTRDRLERLFGEFRFTSIARGLQLSGASSATGAPSSVIA
jgi:polysaccharide deacetylase family protein (PEP-CTERM system associated)